MQPYLQQHQSPDNDRSDAGHRGPLSRTWPQLFKKRRRYSPVRESAQQVQQQQQQQEQQQHQIHQQQQYPPQHAPIQQQPLPQETTQHIPIQPAQQQVQLPIHPLRPARSPSVTAQSVISPGSSIRSPSIAADTASTISSISHASSAPPKKVPIARRASSIATTDSNAAGGVNTPQADLLASKSNYELISSGQHLEMGLHFSTAMATGVMMKRATHRAAEQARRDRMKTAMVDLAEFLLDGEVTFGSGTTCFVVMRGSKDDDAASALSGGTESRKSSVSGMSAGEKKTVNKARLIEMALEKMRAQEKEIDMLRKEIEDMRTSDSDNGGGDRMDVS